VRRTSSAFGERWFCGVCGTPLAMLVTHRPDTLDFTFATLDNPSTVPPGFHFWERSRISWFDTKDALPRHHRCRDDTVGVTPEIAQGAALPGACGTPPDDSGQGCPLPPPAP
jgi:hypothetical protein